MTLENWLAKGWLKKQETSRNEIGAFLGKAQRDAKEAGNEEISPDWRFRMAYDACLLYATTGLRASGYRIPKGSGHHVWTIDSLRLTLGVDNTLVAALQAIRKQRHNVSYDAAGTVSARDIADAIQTAAELGELVVQWLSDHYPHYLSK